MKWEKSQYEFQRDYWNRAHEFVLNQAKQDSHKMKAVSSCIVEEV